MCLFSPIFLRHSILCVCVCVQTPKAEAIRRVREKEKAKEGKSIDKIQAPVFTIVTLVFAYPFYHLYINIITDDCSDSNFRNGITVCWFSEMLQMTCTWLVRKRLYYSFVWVCVCVMFDSIQMLAYSSLNQIMNNCYNVNVDVKSSHKPNKQKWHKEKPKQTSASVRKREKAKQERMKKRWHDLFPMWNAFSFVGWYKDALGICFTSC